MSDKAKIEELKAEGVYLSKIYESKVGYLYPRTSKKIRPKVTPEVDSIAEEFNGIIRELAKLDNKPYLLECLL
jgi:hypothetical protein